MGRGDVEVLTAGADRLVEGEVGSRVATCAARLPLEESQSGACIAAAPVRKLDLPWRRAVLADEGVGEEGQAAGEQRQTPDLVWCETRVEVTVSVPDGDDRLFQTKGAGRREVGRCLSGAADGWASVDAQRPRLLEEDTFVVTLQVTSIAGHGRVAHVRE